MQQTLWWSKSRRAQNTEDYETWLQGGVTPTLNAFDNANENRATVLIIDGTRVGDVRVYEDQVMQTVIQRWGTGGGNVPAIYSIREDAKANNFSATETDTALALQANQPSVQSHHAQIFITQEEPVAYDEYNDSVSEIHHTLRAGTKQSTGVLDAIVRRLTPTECERLQGFPDGWTGEQADSNRYKQMGNAVAVPVVQWIINRVVGE
jgi:DNA (cytosine-5)-methyltransferase 1